MLPLTRRSKLIFKLAAESREDKKKKWKKRLLAAGIGTAVGAGVGGAAFLAKNPGVRADAKTYLKELSQGKIMTKKKLKAQEATASIHPAALENAKKIIADLQGKGVDLKKVRIGISAAAGTGKSTMAKALQQELNLVSARGDRGGRKFLHALRQGEAVPFGSVSEQTHLFNTVDPGKFDVIIRMHRPDEVVRTQIISRGRAASRLDALKYPMVSKSIEDAFTHTRGTAFSPMEGIDIKIKPPEGFKASKLVNKALKAKGIDHSGLSRGQKILSLSTGKRIEKSYGIKRKKSLDKPFGRKKFRRNVAVASSVPVAGGAAGVGLSELR